MKKALDQRRTTTNILEIELLEKAENLWCRKVQYDCFREEIENLSSGTQI